MNAVRSLNSSFKEVSLEDWSERRKVQSLRFQFWTKVLPMELVMLSLIRAFRETNFSLHRQALLELIPFFLANNNVNCARWLPIYLTVMIGVLLEQKHPKVAEEFHMGKFVVYKSNRYFSLMAIDQAHEQSKLIKCDGVGIGVTENPSA